MTDGSLAQLLEKPTNYRLQKVRDGRNFTIRFVEISQKEKPTQVFEFSLQNVANVDVSVTYTPKFPDVKPPTSKNLKQKSFNDSPFFHFCRAESESKVTAYWIKLDDSAQFDHEDIPLLMFSDYGFLAEDSDLITQHSVWIHENGFHRKDWLLLELEKKTEYSKTSVKGRIWSQNGKILLSFIQERSKKTSSSKI